jgi:uncharacterized protein
MEDHEHRAPEQRTIDVDVQDLDTRGRTVVGYAAVYGAEACLNGFTETIQRGAFSGVLDDDVRCLLNHDPNVVLGRIKSGTLRLFDEQRGLRFEVDLPESRSDLREAIARKDLDGASFRFRVAEDKWDGDRRTITRIGALNDITLATYPAYPETSIERRTRNNDGAEERQEDRSMEQGNSTSGTAHELTVDERQRPPAGSLRVEERTGDIRFRTLADLYAERGFFENRTARVGWDEYRSFTWSAGTVLTDLNPIRREGVPLGYDTRWLYPVLPTTAVDDATTAIQYLRQSSRSLAGTAVIRPLTDTSTKPETSSTVEYQTLQLNQVANVQSGIPRIHAAQPMFQSIVEQDLRLGINDGLDEIVRRGVALAGTIVKGTDDILEVTRKAMTLIQAGGYAPDVLAIDPASAQALDLLRTPGTEKF